MHEGSLQNVIGYVWEPPYRRWVLGTERHCGPALQVWFEVSRHTNRVHFHGASDGSALLGLSLPMDLLTVPEDQGTPQTIVDLLHAVEHR